MRHLELKIPPPLVALLCGAAMWYLSKITPVFGLPAELRWFLAGLFVLVGVSLDLRGLLTFLKSGTTVNPLRPHQASALVVTGVYRHTRNPMYLGQALLLSAFAIFLDAPLAWLGIAAFIGYITRFQIQPEEAALRHIFGAAYQNYCERVPRWL
jgi:protein-S-isoprenylcysteine O-methyltransferase Ste14